jgi:hypothetical protein
VPLTSNWPGQRRVGVLAGRARDVQLHHVDLLEPVDQVEVEQPGDAEPDEAGAVGVDEVLLDLHAGAVPHRASTNAWTSEAEQLISRLYTAIDPAVSTVQ